ncbi:MAG TPA: SRPBCC domain-containing protein [Hyphomonadaceae bacterium]
MTTDTQTRMLHDTIVMERTYNASPARVFAAWESVEARLRWSVPFPEAGAAYDQAEFKVGGLDIMRCGHKDDMRYLAHVRYLEILPDRRIVMAERVAECGEIRAASLITIEFEPAGKATKQTVTMQVSAFDGSDMLDGYSTGWTAALDNLAKEFE